MSTTDTAFPLTSPSDPLITFHRLPPRLPSSPSAASVYATKPPAHHVGGAGPNGTDHPPTSFRNPWPSFAQDGGNKGLATVLHTRFLSRERNFVPVPQDREGLVEVVRPDWGWGSGGRDDGGGRGEKQGETVVEEGVEGREQSNATKLKATWIGHSSWLVETGVKTRHEPPMPSITLTDAADEPTTTTLSPVVDSAPPPRPAAEDDPSANDRPEAPSADSASEKKTARTEKMRPDRGIRLLLDPVFSTRMSPVRFAGPKRFSPPPCALADLPDPIDLVLLSHDHYDHLDAPTIRFLVERERRRVREADAGAAAAAAGRGMLFLCGLGVGRHLRAMGVAEEELVECDWWEGVRVQVRGVRGGVRVVCCPSQHFSGRGVWDAGRALWCSWVVEELGVDGEGTDGDGGGVGGGDCASGPWLKMDEGGGRGEPVSPSKESLREVKRNGGLVSGVSAPSSFPSSSASGNKRLYFAGDTGYRTVPPGAGKDRDAIARLPRCPAFAEIGELYGPFDLALLPIGCYSPRTFMSPVHCAPDDAVCMHKELRSKKSIGMHYGTVRGALSEQYEDVREPPRLWKEEAERAGLKWGEEVGVCKIGETVLA